MKRLRALYVTAIIIALAGCASGAKMENMAYLSAGDKYKFDDALNKEVAISSVKGGEETNPLWTSEISNDAFSGAVKMSLESHGLYSDNGKYLLEIELLKVDQPMFGLDMTVTTQVKYTLTDKTNNQVLMDETIEAAHTATVKDAFVAVTRLQLANEGSGRQNIEGLLKKLSELKISASQVSMVR